jgi:FkbM family methyltransferase
MFIPENMLPHIQKIFAGEYDAPFNAPNPVIFDIGANIGAFTRWADARWINSQIFCFEPVKSNFEILQKNISDMNNVKLFNIGIGSSNRKQKIYYGKNNIGEASLFKRSQQIEDGEEVNILSASDLSPCHIMKIDTEGAEIEIIESYKHHPAVYLIEYHLEINRLKIDDLLKTNYILIGSKSDRPNYGILKYALKTLIGE